MPTASAAGVFGMLAGVLASTIESLGDYFASERLSGAPPPPKHAINRGIAVQGIGCLLAGAFGTGNGTTLYSVNIGAIAITKVNALVISVAVAITFVGPDISLHVANELLSDLNLLILLTKILRVYDQECKMVVRRVTGRLFKLNDNRNNNHNDLDNHINRYQRIRILLTAVA